MRKTALFVASAALAILPSAASAAPAKATRVNHDRSPKPIRRLKSDTTLAFRVQSWASLNDQYRTMPASDPQLDIDVPRDGIEEITVFAKRRKRIGDERDESNSPILFGRATVTGTVHSDQANYTGVKITAAIPIAGVPGLDAVINVSGGYEQLNTSATASSAAATMGLRLKF